MPDQTTISGLILLGAPLGNPSDASPRLARTLATADVIAAEDTRRLRRLAGDLGVSTIGSVMSYFEGNERERTPQLLRRLDAGDTVALITDGGMPSVSDPGYRLVAAAIEAGHDITVVPGPSAVTTALAVSGLPCDRFSFEGFLPRKASERHQLLSELATERRTMVFFESPRRINTTMDDMRAAFGDDRRAALCRELTKTYEEVRRDDLAGLADGIAADPPRGELTIVVAGHVPGTSTASPGELAAEVSALINAGVDRKAAMSQVARTHRLAKRVVYDAVVAARHADPS